MWMMMGVGMLVQTLQGAAANQQMAQMRAQHDAQMMRQAMLNQNQQTLQRKDPPKSHSLFTFEGPKFPDENYKNLQDMQMNQAQKRTNCCQQLQNDLQDMKTQFFQENHLQTEVGPDGKPKVKCDDNGQPLVGKGPETAEGRLARTEFEGKRKSELTDQQCNTRDKFMKEEKQKFSEFLTQNREHLHNPAVHGELQKMVVDSKKKALNIQQSQEDERWRVDMPPDEKIAHRLNQGINDLHTMDKEHVKAEQDSPDAKELMEYDKKIAAIFGEKRDQARQEKEQDNFLMDPRKMMAQRASSVGPKDVGEHLPGYLTASMYEMGIYTV